MTLWPTMCYPFLWLVTLIDLWQWPHMSQSRSSIEPLYLKHVSNKNWRQRSWDYRCVLESDETLLCETAPALLILQKQSYYGHNPCRAKVRWNVTTTGGKYGENLAHLFADCHPWISRGNGRKKFTKNPPHTFHNAWNLLKNSGHWGPRSQNPYLCVVGSSSSELELWGNTPLHPCSPSPFWRMNDGDMLRYPLHVRCSLLVGEGAYLSINPNKRVGLCYLRFGIFYLWLVFVAYGKLDWSFSFMVEMRFGSFLLILENRFGFYLRFSLSRNLI